MTGAFPSSGPSLEGELRGGFLPTAVGTGIAFEEGEFVSPQVDTNVGALDR